MKRYFLLGLVAVVPAFAFGTTGCKKAIPSVPDAAVVVATVDTADAGVAPVVTADPLDAGAAAPLATVVTTVVKTVAAPTGGIFQGSYKCFGGMTVTQSGSTAAVRLFPSNSTQYSTMACTVSGEVCDGKVTSFSNGKVAEARHATLKRSNSGDLTYKGDGEAQSTFCKKN